ncbi:MAG: amidohydrolase family protein [Novosphingobium sp.]|nr:amidohydrolase family protein [Novosphingobium sp.]
MLDLKIVGGTIIDGSGGPGYLGEVGVRDGRIVAVGEVSEEARETLDATGRIVAPGFVDVHTHYDAQVFWDPALSPSCFHGVTTVLGGFCGFSVAPLTKEAAGYLAPMLARVEGMPLETLETAVPWNWESFGDYLGLLEGKLGLNAGFYAGHSAIRRVVMGERAVGEEANPEELAQMKVLLGTSLSEGALGLSSTISPTHNDGDGNPVPSRWASREEHIELARVVSEHEGTGVEFLPGIDFDDDTKELMTDLSLASQRAVNWNAIALTGRPDDAEMAASQLAMTDHARSRGGEIIALALPCTPNAYLNFSSGFVFDSLPGIWREVFKWPLEERMTRFRDPDLRHQLAEDAASVPEDSIFMFVSRLGGYKVVSVKSEKNRNCEGRLIDEIAEERGCEPIDVMLDLALDDELTTIFLPGLRGFDHETFVLRGRIWQDDRTIIGASDAGAHLDMIDTFAFSTTVLQEGVRNHKVLTLEAAVHQLTERPARYAGLIERGMLKPGYHADIVVFDAETAGRGPTYNRYDVPCDQFRIYADAEGIDHVFVNGTQIVRDGEHTGKLPGTVLRSGRDTRTMPLDALREPPAKRA